MDYVKEVVTSYVAADGEVITEVKWASLRPMKYHIDTLTFNVVEQLYGRRPVAVIFD